MVQAQTFSLVLPLSSFDGSNGFMLVGEDRALGVERA